MTDHESDHGDESKSYDMDLWKDKKNEIPYIRHEIYLEEEAYKEAVKGHYLDQEEYATPRFAHQEISARLIEKKISETKDIQRFITQRVTAWDPENVPIKLPATTLREAKQVAERNAERFKMNTEKRLKAIRDRKNSNRVWIMVDQHEFRRLYSYYLPGRWIAQYPERGPLPFPDKGGRDEGIDKATLMKCSSLARDFFTWYPDARILHLPLRYPRKHLRRGIEQGEDVTKTCGIPDKHYEWLEDRWMAHLDPFPLVEVLIPWFNRIEDTQRGKTDVEGPGGKDNNIPMPIIPQGLDEKIHLYNTMLQLGVPRFVQKPLIEVLSKQMYQTKLSECHLETLEITIGRLHSKTVTVVDPVLSSFVASYGLRGEGDRNNRRLRPKTLDIPEDDEGSDSEDNFDQDAYTQLKRLRKYLDYGTMNAGREAYPDDTVIVAPILPVLGHSVRHWSGIDKYGNVKNIHMGYPLHIGKMKYYRREIKKRKKDKKCFWPATTRNVKIGDMTLHSEYDVLYPTTRLVGPPGRLSKRAAHWDPEYKGDDRGELEVDMKEGADYW